MPKSSSFEQYLASLKKYMFKHRQLPSFEVMLSVLGVRSKSAVHHFFQQLIEYGFITKDDSGYEPTGKLFSLPAFESIRAWFPTVPTEETRSDINIYDYLVPNPDWVILVKVVWDSMKDAGIMQWDMVVVDKNKTAQPGDIVIAEIDGEFTMKYLEKEKKKWLFLRPWNPHYMDLFPKKSMSVVGVVTGTFRSYT